MRNLKRTLSMLLAVVMVLGLMITGAGAVSLDDFSDRDEIVNDEAVLVLTTLNVINGKSDGSYDPKGTITRGEMAKMICVILNGGAEPVLAETVNNTYTDTVGHWAARYIEYCTTLGIVAGRGDKKFDPDGNVSVAEAGKMLLVALGYNAGVEGYVGNNWQINTDVRANQLDIYDGMEDINTSTILTRDNAALMCYNALDVHMVVYDYIITGNADNAITTKPQLNDTKLGTLLWEKFGAAKVTGVVLANEFANMKSTKQDTDRAPSGTVVGAALDEGKTTVLVTNHGDGQNVYQNTELTFNISTGEDVLGKAVNLYIKPAKDSNNTNRATVIGSAIVSEDNAIITDASGDSLTDVLDDHNLTRADGIKYAYNYASLSSSVPANKDGMKGVERTIIDIDSDNKVDYVLYREMRLGKVTLYSEANKGQVVVAVDQGNYVTKDKADIAGFENVAQDDYVLTAYFGGILHVQEAETVTGKITAYKQTGNAAPYRTTDFTVDSTNYSVSRVKTYAGDITAAVDQVDKSILSSEATFYLDESGNVIAYGEVDENAYKYVLVWGAEAGTRINGDRVKVTREDGTTATYYLNSNSDIDIVDEGADSVKAATGVKANINEDDIVGMVFGYTMTSNGEIKLYLTKGGALTGNTPDFTKGLTTIRMAGAATAVANNDAALMSPAGVVANTASAYYSNNATTFFYVTTKLVDGEKEIDKVSVYNGRNNAPSVDGATDNDVVLALNAKGDVAATAFFDVAVTESAEDHMFVYKANFVSEDYVTVDVFMNGAVEPTKDVKAALYENGEVVHNPDVQKGIYLYKIDSDGNYELTKPTTQAYFFNGTVTRVNKGNNTFVMQCTDGTVEEFRLESKSVVIDYDSDNSNPVAVSNGTVNLGDQLQIIVNNSDDHVVLMAAIMDRVDPSGVNGGSTGVTMSWDGTSKPAGTVQCFDTDVVATTETKIQEAFAAGNNVFIDGDYDLNANLTIPAGRALYVTGKVDETGFKLVNRGSLFVGGNLTTIANSQVSDTERSVLEVHGNWAMNANSATTNGTVRVGQEITGSGSVTLTVAKNSKLYAGVINLGNSGSTLDDKGHIEVKGYVDSNGDSKPGNVTAETVTSNSETSLVVSGTITCVTLNVGTIAKGRIEAGVIVVSGTANVNEGSLTTTSGDLTANTLTLDKATVKVSGGLTVTAALTIPADASVAVTGTLTASAGVTVSSGSLNANTVDLGNSGTLTVEGSANVTVPTVKDGSVDTSGITSGNNVNVGTSKDTVVTLTSEIKDTATYTGEVTIAEGATLAKGVTVTFNGKVNGLGNLTGTDKTSKVVIGSSADVGTAILANFVNGEGGTMAVKDLKGSSFEWNGTAFAASKNSSAYGSETYTEGGDVTARLDSTSIYA
ncbi:MAG: hypothetical protein HFE97_08590 [Oscillospiraceae bacterium]|nr:hypothetical protein [Oscillospiraceae bacterium]